MTKTIIFPVNNKGGVGKTSILTDLSAALAQRHSVGIIDTDHQASLAGTLLGHKDLSCLDLADYERLKVENVTLNDGATLNFNNGLSYMGLEIEPTKAKLAVFPVGTLYKHPEKRAKLEGIVHGDMRDTTFLMVDLPPIPHPDLILDYTIKPLIDICKGDVKLVPLLVSTPEHNVIDIGLRQHRQIEAYFGEMGVPKESIFPISVLNKVPLRRSEEGKIEGSVDVDVIKKLKDLGILYVSPGCDHYAQINHFFKQFEFEGRRIRSVFFPFLDDIKDGRFSLLYGEAPEIHFYPHLVDLVKGNKFDVASTIDPTKRVYMYGLRELTNFVSAHSEVKPRRNYVKKKVVFDRSEITHKVAKDLRDILTDYYLQGEERETELVVTPKYGGSSAEIWFHIPRSLSPEETARALFNTHKQLNPRTETGYEEILEIMKSGENGEVMDNRAYELRDPVTGNSTVSLSYHEYDQNKMRVGFTNRTNDESRNKKCLQHAEVFLRNLETALKKHDKKSNK